MDMPISGLVLIVSMSALGHFLPKLSRPDLCFGVTVDPSFRKTREARRILRDYRIAIWGFALVACLADLAMHRMSVAMVLYAVGTCCALMTSHRSALPHSAPRATMIEVDLSAPQEQIPGGLVTALLPIVLLFGLGLLVVPHLDQLPGRLPVHWDFSGPDGWVITSSRSIIVLLAQYALVNLVLIALGLGVLHWWRRIASSGAAAESERQFRRRTVLLILAVEYLTILPPIFSLLRAPAFAMRM